MWETEIRSAYEIINSFDGEASEFGFIVTVENSDVSQLEEPTARYSVKATRENAKSRTYKGCANTQWVPLFFNDINAGIFGDLDE